MLCLQSVEPWGEPQPDSKTLSRALLRCQRAADLCGVMRRVLRSGWAHPGDSRSPAPSLAEQESGSSLLGRGKHVLAPPHPLTLPRAKSRLDPTPPSALGAGCRFQVSTGLDSAETPPLDTPAELVQGSPSSSEAGRSPVAAAKAEQEQAGSCWRKTVKTYSQLDISLI